MERGAVVDEGFGIVMRSEFASVSVTKDVVANGDRLRIEDLRSGRVSFLDPLELERLTCAGHGQLAGIMSPAAG